MIFTETKLKGAFVIEITKLIDERGFFGRSWCKNEMEANGLKTNIVQVNTSLSIKKGTLRGMHYQKHPHEETKLVRCTRGAIYDVIIDLRQDSASYKEWFGVELNEDNHKMLYVPEKFAHGFITLKDNSEITYFNTQFYSLEASVELRYNDPQFNIKWPLDANVISIKDKNASDFNESMLP
jgi:dTDP-4-dehydrorhamnose 3,5-epimerase